MSITAPAQLSSQDALLVVDVQRDFCPGGALAVPDGDQVVPVLNRWIEAATRGGAVVVASRDWHPAGHVSFTERNGAWPPHCIQDSPGAAFHPELKLPEDVHVVSKGTDLDTDQYSVFDRTGLAEELLGRGVLRLWIGGLAEGVCVKSTALDGARAGFETHLILPATRPIGSPAAHKATVEEARRAGVMIENGQDEEAQD